MYVRPFEVFVVFLKEFFRWFYRPSQLAVYSNENVFKSLPFLPLQTEYLCVERLEITSGKTIVVYQKPGAEELVEAMRKAWRGTVHQKEIS
jgi:hypothetical protein